MIILFFGLFVFGCVFIVDDDEFVCFVVSEVLICVGFQVFEVCDGVDVLIKFFEVRLYVVMFDVDMLQLDGYVVCVEICQVLGGCDMLIMMLIGKDDILLIE